MRDYTIIGLTPYEEECPQVGEPEYRAKAMAAGRRFISLIREECGPEPDGAILRVKAFPHSFGTYYEVVCVYDPMNEDAVEYAFRVEDDAPATW